MKKKKSQNLLRQKRLAKLLSEDLGKTPIGTLMRKAGYSKQYSKSPNQLKKTATWQDLMEKFLPDSFLAERHRDLLNKKEYIAIGKKGEREAVCTGEIDGNAVARGLDMGYKLKGLYSAEKHDLTSNGKKIIGFNYLTPNKDGRLDTNTKANN